MQLGRSSNRPLATAAAVAIVAACGSQSRPAPDSPAAEAEAPAPRREPALAPALAMLPEDTIFVVTGSSPDGVAGAIGWNRLVTDHEPLAEGAREIESGLGRDLLRVEAWGEIGIDTGADFGLAVVGRRMDTVIAFATLASPGALVSELEAIGERLGEDVARERAGDATIFDVGGSRDTRFVVRGDVLMAVFARDPDAAARRAASAEADTSLAGSARYRSAVRARAGTGSAPADGAAAVRGYLDLRPVLEASLGRETLLSLDRLAFDLELGGGRVRARVAAPIAGDGSSAGLLRNGDGVPAIVRATRRTPLILAGATIDPKAGLGLLESLAGAAALDQARGIARRALGVDIDGDLLPLLSGELGFALTSETLQLRGDAIPSALDVNATLGVTDAVAAADLLERITSSAMLAQFVTAREDGGVTVPIPEFKPLHIAVRGSAVAASTDPAFLERVGRDSAASFAGGAEAGAHGELMVRPGPAAVSSMHPGVTGFWLLTSREDSAVARRSAVRAPSSEAYEELKSELAEVDRATQAAEDEAAEARAALSDVLASYGPTALSLRVEDGALVGEGGQFLASGHTLADLVHDTLERGAALEARHRQTSRLRHERWQLESRMRRMRNAADGNKSGNGDGGGAGAKPD